MMCWCIKEGIKVLYISLAKGFVMHELVVNWCRTKLSCLVGAADLRSEKACFISRIVHCSFNMCSLILCCMYL